MLKNIWSCNDPTYNSALHISMTNIKFFAILSFIFTFFFFLFDSHNESFTHVLSAGVSFAFVFLLFMKASHAVEILYGSTFQLSMVIITVLLTSISFTISAFPEDAPYKHLEQFLLLYGILIPIRLFIFSRLKSNQEKRT